MRISPTTGYKVRYAPGIYEKACASVGALEPEHYAILGGYLDDPFYITDFMPMPPLQDHRGGYRSSLGAVTLNGPFIEYYLNTCLAPFGKYFLGVMHSHPGGMNHLSNGIPDSGQGDIPSMRGHLEAAARYGEPWHHFIAPIVTHPGSSPCFDTWIVTLDSPSPILAETIWETEEKSAPIPTEEDNRIEEMLDLLRYRPDLAALILSHSYHIRPFLRSYQARDEWKARLLMQHRFNPRRRMTR